MLFLICADQSVAIDTDGSDLFANMRTAIAASGGQKLAFICNRTVRAQMDWIADQKSRILIPLPATGNAPFTSFDGLPVVIVDG